MSKILIPLAVLGPVVLTLVLGVLLAWLGPFLTRYFKQNAHNGIKSAKSGVSNA